MAGQEGNDYGLELVNIRLVPDRKIMSEKKISSAWDAIDVLKNELKDFDREHFVILNLATNGSVLNANICSIGGLSSTIVEIREVMKAAILSNASSFIVLHNHPSGNLTPSSYDDETTRRLYFAGKLLNIKLLDHIVVGSGGDYYSYQSEGRLRDLNLEGFEEGMEALGLNELGSSYVETEKSKEKKESFRDKVAAEFIKSLEEDPKTWVKKWASNDTGRPFNMASGREYNGLNAAWLKFIEKQRGFRDPRWLTFNQVKKLNETREEDNKIKVPKGTKMTQVEYFFMWDHLNKKTIPWEEYNRLSPEERSQRVDGEGNLVTDPSLMGTKVKDRFELRSRDHYVFNASQLENMPEYVYDRVQNDIAPSEVVNRIAEGMGVKIREEEQDRAFYRPSIDTITLPLKSQFESDYDYQSTALHELGHATGHESRLNRNIHNDFGSPEYAYEELIAEMTSCFMGEYVESPMNDKDLDNHIAYVQNWIEAIKKDKNYLFKAIKEADKAADYMIEKGSLEELKERVAEEDIKVNKYEYSDEKTVEKGVVDEPYWTYCTNEEWEGDNFDLYYFESENGRFHSYEEAKREAEKHGAEKVFMVEEPSLEYGAKPSILTRPIGLNTFAVFAPSGNRVHADILYMGSEEECDKYIEVRKRIEADVKKNGYELIDFGRSHANTVDAYLYTVLAYNKGQDSYTTWSYNADVGGLSLGHYGLNDASGRLDFYERMDECLRPPFRISEYSGEYTKASVKTLGSEELIEDELSKVTVIAYTKTLKEGKAMIKGMSSSVSNSTDSNYVIIKQIALEELDYDLDGDLISKEVIMTTDKPVEYNPEERILKLAFDGSRGIAPTYATFTTPGDQSGIRVSFDGRSYIDGFYDFCKNQIKDNVSFWKYAVERDVVSAKDALVKMYLDDAPCSLDRELPEPLSLTEKEKEAVKDFFNEVVPLTVPDYFLEDWSKEYYKESLVKERPEQGKEEKTEMYSPANEKGKTLDKKMDQDEEI